MVRATRPVLEPGPGRSAQGAQRAEGQASREGTGEGVGSRKAFRKGEEEKVKRESAFPPET